MRHWFVIALAALVTLGWSADAEAGKKEKAPKEEKPAAEATEDKGIEILETGIAEVDTFFATAKAPIDTITNTKNGLTKLNTDLNTALGLAADAPFETAIADLKTKAEGKISVAMDGAMPKLTAADGCPENVTAAVTALNGGFDALAGTVAGLKDLPAQFANLISEGQKFADPNTLKGMVSDPIMAVKGAPKVAKNIKALGTAKTEVEELITSLDTLKKTVSAIAQ